MTHDEHTTRAMLLGRTYDSRTNTYADWRNQQDRFLDADTLEVIEHDAFRARLTLFFNKTDKKKAAVYRDAIEGGTVEYLVDRDLMSDENIAALGR